MRAKLIKPMTKDVKLEPLATCAPDGHEPSCNWYG